MANASSQLRVFLTDDSAIVRDRLRTLFSILPLVYVCGEADNATDAIAEIQTSRADVILLDLDLRESSGLEVLEAVKKTPCPPVVIVLSIHPARDLADHYLQAGADHYFEKGLTIEPIMKLLEELSRRHVRQAS